MEILAMLLSGKSSACSETVMGSNLEHNTVQLFNDRPNPRIMHSHLPYTFLPTKHIENRYKIVLVLRNPKDRLMSYFTMIRGIRSAFNDLQWSDYFTARAMAENGKIFSEHRKSRVNIASFYLILNNLYTCRKVVTILICKLHVWFRSEIRA